MTHHELLEELKLADPAPVDAERPETAWSAEVVLQAIQHRSGTMQTLKPTPDPGTSRPGHIRRRGLLVATGALMIAIIAVGAVVGLMGRSSDESDLGVSRSGPINSLADITGTYLRNGPGAPTYLLFSRDGTVKASPDTELIENSPITTYQTTFEGTTVFVTTTDVICNQPDPGGTYEIRLLGDGNLRFVAVEDDPCDLRSRVLQGFGNDDVVFKPVP